MTFKALAHRQDKVTHVLSILIELGYSSMERTGLKLEPQSIYGLLGWTEDIVILYEPAVHPINP